VLSSSSSVAISRSTSSLGETALVLVAFSSLSLQLTSSMIVSVVLSSAVSLFNLYPSLLSRFFDLSGRMSIVIH
jgi:hypothetical protein